MANEEQLSILQQGVDVWNKWREENPDAKIDLSETDLQGTNLSDANLRVANLSKAKLQRVNLSSAKLGGANLTSADLAAADLRSANLEAATLNSANLTEANLTSANLDQAVLTKASLVKAIFEHAFVDEAELDGADLDEADLHNAWFRGNVLMGASLKGANLSGANMSWCDIREADFGGANLNGTNFLQSYVGNTILRNIDLSAVHGLNDIYHISPSSISMDTFVLSKGKIPEVFLRGCGLNDWEIEEVKLYNPDLSNDEVNKILYRIYNLRATRALQISPLFISYSHDDGTFVDKIGDSLTQKGVRYWRDIHEMKAGRIETQIYRAISQNRTVLLILSEHSLSSDWVEHEVRTARGLEKEMGRDVLCPVALDDSWKDSRWPKRIMEQIMEYNILDFSEWQDDSKFDFMFRKLIDGLELFYKG